MGESLRRLHSGTLFYTRRRNENILKRLHKLGSYGHDGNRDEDQEATGGDSHAGDDLIHVTMMVALVMMRLKGVVQVVAPITLN